jgi:hypothetical protein
MNDRLDVFKVGLSVVLILLIGFFLEVIVVREIDSGFARCPRCNGTGRIAIEQPDVEQEGD